MGPEHWYCIPQRGGWELHSAEQNFKIILERGHMVLVVPVVPVMLEVPVLPMVLMVPLLLCQAA